MDRLLRRLSEFIIGHRILVVAFLAAITCVLVFTAATRLTINNDHDTWLPRHNEVAKLLRQADADFSSNVMLFAVIEFKDGVFTPENLALLDRITKELEGIDELFNVTSLTNIIDIRKIEDGIEVGDLVRTPPTTEEEVQRLRDYVLSKETYVNTIVSSDERYAAIMTNIVSSEDEVKVAQKIFNVVDSLAGGHVRYYGGDPSVNYYLNYYMVQDLKTLLPLGVIVVMAVIYVGMRRFSGVILPMTIVFFAIVWTFGLMAVFGYPVNILSPAVVVLLIALGTDYAVHYYNHHIKRGDVTKSTTEISVPVTMSALTTIVSLLTFATTRIEVFKNFGIELAFGLAVAWILSIVLMAVLVSFFRIKPETIHVVDHPSTTFTRFTDRLGSWVHDHAKMIIASVALLSFGMALGVPRIMTDVDFIGQLPKDSPPREGCNILQDHFSGMYPFNLYIRGPIDDPALMNRMQYLENCMRTQRSASSFTSINALIAQENWLLNGVYAVPETKEGIANLWFMLEGHEVLKTFVTEDRTKGLVNSIVRESSTEEMRFLADRFDELMKTRLSDEILTIDPSRLTEEGRNRLQRLRAREASEQIAWLSAYYGKSKPPEVGRIEERLLSSLGRIDSLVGKEAAANAVRTYLEKDAVEVLPQALVEKVSRRALELWDRIGDKDAQEELASMIVSSGAMNRQDALATIEGMLERASSEMRIQKAKALRASLAGVAPEALMTDEDYVKRIEGVLWELLSPNAVMFSKQLANVPGIENAIVTRTTAKIDQAGMPATVRLVHHLLINSQVQSLVLAISIVFLMVSLTYTSLRRGLTSMVTVLVPLVFILGFMGLKGIPLDIGTVLCGSLIVGLGIDGSIHFLHYYNRLHNEGVPKKQAIRMTLGHVGKAVCTANGTTLAGFLVCLLSDVTAVKNFATLNSIAIVLVTLSIMTLLPALVSVLHLDKADDIEEKDVSSSAVARFRMKPAGKEAYIQAPGTGRRKAGRSVGG